MGGTEFQQLSHATEW